MRLSILPFFLFLSSILCAQSFTISGKVVDTETMETLTGAHVSLKHPWDEIYKTAVTNTNGVFELKDLSKGGYALQITYIGYSNFDTEITVVDKNITLGEIKMSEGVALSEVEITAKLPLAEQKGDTTQYNADAYKVMSDASAGELIEKMPGVVIRNGKIQAQGEDVNEILVDGKPFFGNDPQAALKNLPAEVISKIQVYDQTSEQSSFSGFKDGETTKTINIITRPEMRNGQFGKIYGGYGYKTKYQGGGNTSLFNGDQRISFIGQTNNINEQNFASEDLLGVTGSSGGRGGMRGGRGGGGRGGGSSRDFLIDQQNGIAATNAFGLNYSDQWGKKMEVTGSYFFNMTDISSKDESNREFINDEIVSEYYNETNTADTKNYNHRFNARIRYKIDSLNELSIRPRLSLQKNDGISNTFGQSLFGTELVSQTDNQYSSDLAGIDFSNSINYQRRLNKPGRTVSLDFRQGYNNKMGESKLNSTNDYFGIDPKIDTINQLADLDIDGWSLSSNFTYTEPLGKQSRLMLTYRYSYDEDNSDKRTYDFSESSQDYSDVNEELSNVFKNKYITHQTGAGYNFNKGRDFFIMARANVQWSTLNSDEIFPQPNQITQNFVNFLPMAMIRYNFERQENLRVFYMGRTQSPSVEQLQNVIDNSNPLQLSIGNPELDQAYTHRVSARYSKTNTDKATVFYFMLNSSFSDEYIGNATYLKETDNPIFDDITLERGAQLTRPVNLKGYKSGNIYSTYGFPISKIKSNFNIDLSGSINKTPGLINDESNISTNKSLGAGISLSSNVSKYVDFTISTRSNYNEATNSIQTGEEENATYLNQDSRIKFNVIFPKGIVFRTNVSHQLYTGLSDGFDDSFFLWSAGIGKKLFKNQRGEITLSVFDILEQNQSITRNVTETYIEDIRSKVLQRYLMLTFAYNFRNYNSGKKETKSEREDRGRWGR
jgi:outer membrane beta-barrel protein/carboxypeptidase-like protein